MLDVLFALAPIFILILGGYFLKNKNIVKVDFWQSAEHLTYYVFFPALLFYTTAKAQVHELNILPMVWAVVGSKLLIAAMSVQFRPYLGLSGPAFTSVFQGSIRFNTYVALAGASALWGQAGLTLVAIAAAFCVPLVNVLCIIVMETYGDREFRLKGPNWKRYAKAILTNPLILASALGGGYNLTGFALPPVIEPLLDILARAALPIGLLCVGAGLVFRDMKQTKRGVFVSCLLKLLVLPGATLLACMALGVEGMTRDVMVYFSAMPVASASFVLARKMGGDTSMMASVITTSTLLAMGTLPLIYFVLQMV